MKRVNGSRQLSVPNWAISLMKFLAPVLTAVAIGYARFIQMENRVIASENELRRINGKSEANELVVGAMDRRLNTAEVKQQVLEKDLQASLTRIETTVRDVQSDIKEIQKGGFRKP